MTDHITVQLSDTFVYFLVKLKENTHILKTILGWEC
jgi:hypothetical protein